MNQHRNRRLRAAAVVTALAAAVLTGCGSAAGPGARPPASAVGGPSKAAKIVCADEAKEDISGALGVDTTRPLAPVWSNGLYSCRYVYPDGSMLLSVKDLPDAAATAAYFTALRNTVGNPTALDGLGEASFAEPDGSVVVRKDDTVLVVDVSGLPATVGKPVRPRASAARTVATTVLICWKEG